MRYFLELAYNGTSFHGWQVQPNAVSVQSTIENALAKILQSSIPIVGAGRTDTGVHARQMFAHFDYGKEIKDIKKFLLSLNSIVGRDICIKNLSPVDVDAHARFDASQRTYKYFVSFSRNPFLKDFFWVSPSYLDLDKMNLASRIIEETSDFTSFAKLHSDAKTNICKVSNAEWCHIRNDKQALEFIGDIDDGIVFTISADRFLRNMVRAIVGTLVDVGRNKMDLKDFRNIIEEKNRCSAGMSMPANALFLWDIKYPFF